MFSSNLEIYDNYGFKFFPCRADKTPETKGDWRLPENQLSREQAEKLLSIGHMIGAWIPDDVIILDLDRHADQPDGVKEFKKIKEDYNITFDLMDSTFIVQTGGNGLHVFFTVPKDHTFRQGHKAPGIDLKTHKGYVIAAGSPGYKIIADYEPCPLPENLSLWLESLDTRDSRGNAKTQDSEHTDPESEAAEKKYLPVKLLKSILKKVDVRNFRDNGRWIEFVMSIKATCGDTPDVKDAIIEWSARDAEYDGKERTTFTRIDSTTDDGGITIGTFIMILQEEGVSSYLIKQVSQFESISSLLTESESEESCLPFPDPDYITLAEHPKAFEFFNICGHTAAADLLVLALRNRVIFVEVEKKNYFFTGSRWEEVTDIYSIMFTVLLRTTKYLFNSIERSDANNKRFSKLIKCIHERRWKHDVLSEFNLKNGIKHHAVAWDSPDIRETMTTRDGVIAFDAGRIEERAGRPEEWRLKYAPFTNSEIMNATEPAGFIDFLQTIFPNDETLQTATFALSLCVSGNAAGKLFHIWEGAGYNGKSTLTETMKRVLGNDKAITYDAKMLLDNKLENGAGNARPDLAKFQGAYAAFANETEKGKKFSMALIKLLTGGDSITARRLFQDEITFAATWQLILAVNDLPSFAGDDPAFVDRLLIIPFVRRFYKSAEQQRRFLAEGVSPENILPAGDQNEIEDRLFSERAGILRYLIEQYIRLQTEFQGTIPRSVECKAVKDDFVNENDVFGLFMKECCIVEPGKDYFTASTTIMDAYKEFIGSTAKMSASRITRQVKKHDKRVESGVKRVRKYDEGLQTFISKPMKGLLHIRLRGREDEEREAESGGHGGAPEEKQGGLYEEEEELFNVM